jgi:hypothetical protein
MELEQMVIAGTEYETYSWMNMSRKRACVTTERVMLLMLVKDEHAWQGDFHAVNVRLSLSSLFPLP